MYMGWCSEAPLRCFRLAANVCCFVYNMFVFNVRVLHNLSIGVFFLMISENIK